MSGSFASGLSALGAALADRFFPSRIASVDALGRFVGSRSAYLAQTSLYGYLKTRMGTKFPQFFEDPGFAAEIRAAATQVFASCAGDLAIHAAAVVGDAGRLDPDACAGLARRCFADALAAGDPAPASDGATADFAAATAAFAIRTQRTRWPAAVQGMEVFAGSGADVVRFAPISDEFKALDRTIVENSTRFRWIGVRDVLARRLDVASVAADWRAGGSG